MSEYWQCILCSSDVLKGTKHNCPAIDAVVTEGQEPGHPPRTRFQADRPISAAFLGVPKE